MCFFYYLLWLINDRCWQNAKCYRMLNASQQAIFALSLGLCYGRRSPSHTHTLTLMYFHHQIVIIVIMFNRLWSCLVITIWWVHRSKFNWIRPFVRLVTILSANDSSIWLWLIQQLDQCISFVCLCAFARHLIWAHHIHCER